MQKNTPIILARPSAVISSLSSLVWVSRQNTPRQNTPRQNTPKKIPQRQNTPFLKENTRLIVRARIVE